MITLISALGCAAFLKKWYWPAVVAGYVCVGEPLLNSLIEWIRDEGFHLSMMENTLSAVSSIVIDLWILTVFAGVIGSRAVKAYFDGVPSYYPGDDQNRDWLQSGDPSLKRAAVLMFVLAPVAVITVFWNSRSVDPIDESDGNGFRQHGYARIEVEQKGSDDLFFSWDGCTVSCIKLWKGRIKDTWIKQPIWTTLSLENGRACIKSPVRYGLIRDDCADSAVPAKLEKGRTYTVGIGRLCDIEPGLGPDVGTAYREFVLR